MVNINLTTAENEGVKKEFPYKKGLTVIIIALVIVGAAYGGIIQYSKQVSKADADAKSTYLVEYDKLAAGSAKEVLDFEQRLELSKSLLSENDATMNSLTELEKTVVPGVYLASYEYNNQENSIKVQCVGENFRSVAQQLVSFKKSALFSSASVGETTLTEKGKVNFPVNLKIK